MFFRYSDELYSYSLKILHSSFWAEEAVQVLFCQLWTSRQTLDAVSNPRSFLFKMAANRSIDILRKNERFFRAHIPESQTSENDTSQHVELRESERIIQQAIESLPAKRKLIYLLKNNGELTYDEIANELHVSVHTVRNQLAKAVDNIRTYLIAHGVSMTLILLFSRL